MLDRIDVKFFKLAVGADRIGKESDVDISAKCPVCGDSAKRKNSKRLHLYIKNNITNVSCFNGDCPCKNKTVYSFLKDFYPALFDQYKRENFSDTLNRLSTGDFSDDVFSVHKQETKKELDKTIIIAHDLSEYFKKIEESKDGLDYVKSRGFEYNGEYGQWYFGFQNLTIGEKFYNITDSIIIPLYHNGKMYGFYSRNIHNKNFSTYMNEANIGYKIWNWFNIDKSKPVYIFEGIFDALSLGYNNVIAAIGATIPIERIKELKEPIFVSDNDKTGVLNSIKYSNLGHKVYIQPSKYREKDLNQLKLNNRGLDLKKIVDENLFSGMMAEIRLKEKL